MAPSRGKGKAAAGRAQPIRRTTRARGPVSDGVPDVYSAMLTDVHSDEGSGEDRPLKKRRITPRKPGQRVAVAEQVTGLGGASKTPRAPPSATRVQQMVVDSSESEADELDFEDVDLDAVPNTAGEVDGIEDLSISVESQHALPHHASPHHASSRRKPASTVEKSHRLLVHKLHVLCLLGHCMYVNGRCNNVTAQRHLRSLLSAKTVSYLKPPKHETQFQRNRSFMDGLQQALDAFVPDYKITASGLTRARWNIDGDPQQELGSDAGPVDSIEFISAASNLEGSQDMASQLLCTMLRSVGVEARIVCSLQPLPFTSVPKAATPKKPAKVRIMAIAPDADLSRTRRPEEDAAFSGSRMLGKVPSARRRLGQPSFAEEANSFPQAQTRPKSVVKLSFPVFWVEAFNEAYQKWVAVDPIVTNTINKPTKLEPPASYELNQLMYAIGFESDGSARDITRRYAKAYNAKTRRHRVEASADGAKWWHKVMRVFRRPDGLLDRDQVEDAELAQKEAREGLPGNILDFKDHPYYALERHLKRLEVIHPRREVGKVNAGTAAKPKMEPVFRRKHVLACKSADKWYRSGREIKANEQPLKHVPARARRHASPADQSLTSTQAPTTALYAPFQTRLYVPPAVQRGRVPRNAYGNLDVYVPTMVPAGGVHIRNALTPQAAKLLRVDYADAVIGFQFKGRHGTAVVEGAVVASQFADAIRAVIDGLEYTVMEDDARARSLVALKTWKRFLVGLRIAERVRAYGHTPSMQHDEGTQEYLGSGTASVTGEDLLTAGRFSLRELDKKSKPAARKRRVADSESEVDSQSNLGDLSDHGGFVLEPYVGDAESDDRLFDADELSLHAGTSDASFGKDTRFDDTTGDQRGGFIVEDTKTYDNEGGFIIEGNDREDDEGGGLIIENEESNNERDTAMPDTSVDDAWDVDPNDRTLQTEASNGAADIAACIGHHHHRELGPPADRLPNDEERQIILVDKQLGTAPDDDIEGSAQVVAQGEAEPGEESDKDSMLSHDPEDDEAEPDWLESE